MSKHEHEEQKGIEELDSDFAFKDEDVKKLVKKAKRKTILRNTVISIIVTPVLLFAGVAANSALVNQKHWDVYSDLELHERISGPNVFLGNNSFNYSFLNGTFTSKKYKMIEGRVIPWEDETVEFNVFGSGHPIASGRGSVQINEHASSPQIDRFYDYQSGERVLLFYHPSLKYEHYFKDFDILEKVKDDQFIEMAISLDKGYTFDAINTMLPKDVDATWYRVNSYSKERLELEKKDTIAIPEQAQEVYGFDAYFDPAFKDTKRTEDDFIEDVKRLKDSKNNNYYTSYAKDHLYDVVKENQKDGMIIGVVVTGTKEQLMELKGLPFVTAAVMGATVDQY
ncbi:anti sigma factor C-terminal domain-containing protein [Neobacillus sp. D3-1R]|uniref:anti sigma factor C-terminal domain-containing protein n=1 Tax=Neobacillus sp. D3-1R TaxID=3445778 RepID=UPI003FA18BC3